MSVLRALALGFALHVCCAGLDASFAASPVDIGSIDAAPSGSASLLVSGDGVTAISGRVLSIDATPLAGVTIVDGTIRAMTDAEGRYLLEDVPAGSSVLVLDARAAEAAVRGKTSDFGYYEVAVSAAAGKTTRLPYVNWLTPIDHGHDVAFQQALGNQMGGAADGPFSTVVDVGGTNVNVDGAVVSGNPRIGTAYIPP